eukprot:SRR837773.7988.p1 GENE.SRR837773.7988~~SRR837773.7988.p1  ORF type:complete len:262 (-),score=43.11 SRR837773.7988:77-781(-)
MGRQHDIAIVAAAAGAVIAVTVGMFATVQGGGMPTNGWFSWHPVLMTLAFPGLMSVGRLSYFADSSWPGMESKENRRFRHRVIMSLAVLVALVGYLCIFKAHLPAQKFFGYDFKNHQWAPVGRVVHVWLGYSAVALSVYQAVTGMLKVNALNQGNRIFTNHGTIGKAIMSLGLGAVLAACYFWAWAWPMKLVVAGFACGAVLGNSRSSGPRPRTRAGPSRRRRPRPEPAAPACA